MTANENGGAKFFASVYFADADAGIEWLERTVGCRPRAVHRDEDGKIGHAEIEFGSSILMTGSAGTGREPFKSMPAGGSITYCAVTDPDALHDRALAAGAEVVLPLTDTNYGSRDFTLRDPEGNLWAFGTYRPEVSTSAG